MSVTVDPEMRRREVAYAAREAATVSAARRAYLKRLVPAALVALAAAILLAAGYQLGARAALSPAVLVSSVDDHGRVCTTAAGLGIDCDFEPAGLRLDGWLEDLSRTPPGTTP